MPDCPACDCELEDDTVFGVLWCFRCDTNYMLDADGFLVLYEPRRITDVSLAGRFL